MLTVIKIGIGFWLTFSFLLLMEFIFSGVSESPPFKNFKEFVGIVFVILGGIGLVIGGLTGLICLWIWIL